MKLTHLLTQGHEQYGIKGKFEKGVLYSGKPVLVFTNLQTGNDEQYVVLASLRNWPRFEKWVGLRSKIDFRKTSKTLEMLRGEELQGVLVNAKVYIMGAKENEEDNISDKL